MTCELYRAEGLPVLQNQVFDTPEVARACPVGDVLLTQSATTGLFSNVDFDPQRVIYDETYQNEQAHSPAFERHLEDVLAIIADNFGQGSLLEVGCGKGHFLRKMKEAGFNARGIDPAYEGDDQDVIKANFDPSAQISADAIVLRHVLEHVQDPLSFLSTIAVANGGRGLIYIEVPCLDWIIQHEAWFDIFYEHANYFRLDDFNRIFAKVSAAGRFFGEQYLYVVADLSSLRSLTPAPVLSSAVDLAKARNSQLSRIAGRRAAVWGGSSKGVIFSIFLERSGSRPLFAIDINPAKQGRYLPVTALPVVSPEFALTELSDGDTILIMNSVYADEIRATGGNRFNYITVDDR